MSSLLIDRVAQSNFILFCLTKERKGSFVRPRASVPEGLRQGDKVELSHFEHFWYSIQIRTVSVPFK